MSGAEILAALRQTARERPLVMTGVGCGLTAAGAAKGGADLLATYSTAVFRRMGLPSALSFLPYHDANAVALEALAEVGPQKGGIPLLVGLGAHDPRQPLEALLDRAEAAGAAGVMNEPFLGMYGPAIRDELERAGLGFAREVELIERAARRGLLAFGWAFSAEEARILTEAGAGLIGAMLGPTRGTGEGSAQAMADALAATDGIAGAALAAGPEVLVLAHGGLLSDPATVGAFLARSRSHGYATGSSAERAPVIDAVAQAVAAFGTSPDRREE